MVEIRENGTFDFVGAAPDATSGPTALTTATTGSVGGGRILGEIWHDGHWTEGENSVCRRPAVLLIVQEYIPAAQNPSACVPRGGSGNVQAPECRRT